MPARTRGGDNYSPKGNNTHGSNEFHYQGKDCLRCHTAGAKATVVPFTMAGTVYKDILGSEPLAGAEVILLDSAGKTISMTTNAAGNFMTQTPIAKDASGKGTYKTWILSPDGKTLPMVTMTSGSCNMHHAPLVYRGTMWAGAWSAAPNAPAQGVSFSRDVLAILNAKCMPCHAPLSDGEKNLPDAKTGTYDLTAGVDLTEYDAIIEVDNSTMPPTLISRKGVSGRPLVNLTNVDTTPFDDRENSLILEKMLGPETAHGGGRIAVNKNDQDFYTFLLSI